MKHSRYMFVFIAVLAAVLLLLSVNAAAETELKWEALAGVEEDEDMMYVRITGVENPESMITIPSTIAGLPVRKIGPDAFKECEEVQHIVISEGVKIIQAWAFMDCPNLRTVQLPSTMTYIGQEAFCNCSSLARINLPELVTELGPYAFSGCESLTDLYLPSNLTQTWNGTFSGQTLWCRADTETARYLSTNRYVFRSPNAPEYVIRYADKIEDYNNGSSTYAENGDGLAIVEYLETDSDLTVPSEIDGVGIEIIDSAFCENIALRNVVIPDGVKRINGSAFEDCTNLKTVQLPESVTYIGQEAFENCSALVSVNIPEPVTELGPYAFNGCESLEELQLPGNISRIGNRTFSGQTLWCRADTKTARCLSASEIVFRSPSAPDYVIRYADRIEGYGSAASDYEGLQNGLKIVEYLGDASDLEVCSRIDGVAIAVIGTAFSENKALTSVVIPNGVFSVNGSAFAGCVNLKTIRLPQSVAFIGQEAFRDCSALTSVNIPAEVTELAPYTFAGCKSLTDLYLPANISRTGNGTFSGQTLWCRADTQTARHLSVNRYSFRSPNAPEYGIRYADLIEDYDAGESTYAKLGDGLIIVEYFGDAANLKICPEIDGIGIELIGCAFSGNEALTSVVIPDGVKRINWFAFGKCENLALVTIPDSVTCIRYDAFAGCSALTDVYYAGSESQWNAIDIKSGNGCLTEAALHFNSAAPLICVLTLPSSLTAIESGAFTGLPATEAIRIPAGVTAIAEDAFDPGMTLIVPAGSPWIQWAEAHGYAAVEED